MTSYPDEPTVVQTSQSLHDTDGIETDKGGTILIVDDLPENLDVLTLALENQGYELCVATNGWIALEQIQDINPDLILLDIRMPEIDGYETCQRLKSNPLTCSIPVIFISALDDVLDKVKAFGVGGADYLTKPFQTEEMLARIHHQLRICRLQRQLEVQNQQLQYEIQERKQSQEALRQLTLDLEKLVELRTEQLKQAYQIQVDEMDRLNHLKDDFLNTISHELRTPIANIRVVADLLPILFAQVLGETAQPSLASKTKIDKYIRILREECDRELLLIQNLLDLQHLEAGTFFLEPAQVQLDNYLKHLLEPFETRIQQQQQHLQVQILSNLPPITIDSASFNRVFFELLHNACKYTPSGETITVAVEIEADYLILKISNSGITIHPDELARIFDKFYRIPNHDPWKHGGTGLGLALVKRLVEHLNGTITVQSENHLTCFTVRLQLRNASG